MGIMEKRMETTIMGCTVPSAHVRCSLSASSRRKVNPPGLLAGCSAYWGLRESGGGGSL